MENIIYILAILMTLLILKIIFNAKAKDIKKFESDEELEKIVEKLPDNEQLARIYLQKLNNNTVKIDKWNDEKIKTSIYNAMTNTITIGKIDKMYTRIQTIAHECLHSVQPKRILKFNFWFSNINILYFIVLLILTLFRIIEETNIQIFILLMLGIIQYSIKSYLEQDAMTKAKYLVNEYFDTNNDIENTEKEKLLKKYEELNEKAIPFVSYSLIFSELLKILLYLIIVIII